MAIGVIPDPFSTQNTGKCGLGTRLPFQCLQGMGLGDETTVNRR